MIVWEKKVKHTHYQVRSAGSSLRLYSNGVFHSQFNSNVVFGGQVWDLLLLPALYTTSTIKRVLVLGVGGGAAIRHVHLLFQPDQIVGVELDPVHIRIAKRFFGINDLKNVELIQADAIAWLEAYRGKKFDLIIDDLFCHHNGEATRAIPVNDLWAAQLLKKLSQQGVLVINFDSLKSLKKSSFRTNAGLANEFVSHWCYQIKGFDNRIGAFQKGSASKEIFAKQLIRISDTFGKGSVTRLNAVVKKLTNPNV